MTSAVDIIILIIYYVVDLVHRLSFWGGEPMLLNRAAPSTCGHPEQDSPERLILNGV